MFENITVNFPLCKNIGNIAASRERIAESREKRKMNEEMRKHAHGLQQDWFNYLDRTGQSAQQMPMAEYKRMMNIHEVMTEPRKSDDTSLD